MAGRKTGAHEAAEKEFKAAKNKPSARELAKKHGLNESTIHRAIWFVEHKAEKKASRVKS